MHLQEPADDAIILSSDQPLRRCPPGICLPDALARGLLAHWTRGCKCSGADNPHLPHNTIVLILQLLWLIIHRWNDHFNEPSLSKLPLSLLHNVQAKQTVCHFHHHGGRQRRGASHKFNKFHRLLLSNSPAIMPSNKGKAISITAVEARGNAEGGTWQRQGH